MTLTEPHYSRPWRNGPWGIFHVVLFLMLLCAVICCDDSDYVSVTLEMEKKRFLLGEPITIMTSIQNNHIRTANVVEGLVVYSPCGSIGVQIHLKCQDGNVTTFPFEESLRSEGSFIELDVKEVSGTSAESMDRYSYYPSLHAGRRKSAVGVISIWHDAAPRRKGKYEIWASARWVPMLSSENDPLRLAESAHMTFEIVMPTSEQDRMALKQYLGIEIEDFVNGAKPPGNYMQSYQHEMSVVQSFPRSQYAYLLTESSLKTCPPGHERSALMSFQKLRLNRYLVVIAMCLFLLLTLLMVALYVWWRGGIRHLLDAIRKRNRNVESGRIVH